MLSEAGRCPYHLLGVLHFLLLAKQHTPEQRTSGFSSVPILTGLCACGKFSISSKQSKAIMDLSSMFLELRVYISCFHSFPYRALCTTTLPGRHFQTGVSDTSRGLHCIMFTIRILCIWRLTWDLNLENVVQV